jgi:SAM-dependent methyltransferase
LLHEFFQQQRGHVAKVNNFDSNRCSFSHSAQEEYEADLNRGISLSGETKEYFVQGRLDILRDRLLKLGADQPKSILDFGCGTGDSAIHLAKLWPEARVVGVDTSESLISVARLGSSGIESCEFHLVEQTPCGERFDLVYCNGVFHHIPPSERAAALRWIRSRTAPDAYFSLWENNSWNPGTKWVMRRIPFDRDASPISPVGAVGMLKRNGFGILTVDYAFFFPRCLAALRPIEKWMQSLPLGAQYQVLCQPKID